MPVYVYRNLVTNETFEIQQRITEDALTTDPRTGDPVRRVIQPVGIAFKGAGFYVNDSRSTNGSAAPGTPKDKTSDAPAPASDAGGSAGSNAASSASASSSDSKPASTATASAS